MLTDVWYGTYDVLWFCAVCAVFPPQHLQQFHTIFRICISFRKSSIKCDVYQTTHFGEIRVKKRCHWYFAAQTTEQYLDVFWHWQVVVITAAWTSIVQASVVQTYHQTSGSD